MRGSETAGPVSVAVRGHPLEPPVLLHLDRGVRQAQRLRDRVDHARQHGLRRCGGLEALRETGDGGGGIVALAVEEAVDAALQAGAQRVEHDGHQAGRDDRRADADLIAAGARRRAAITAA